MDQQTTQPYKKMLTEIMQKIIAVLGPQLAFALAKNINSLTIAENGEVTAINGDPKNASAKLIENITSLSQPLEKKIIQPILKRYLYLESASQQSNQKVDQ